MSEIRYKLTRKDRTAWAAAEVRGQPLDLIALAHRAIGIASVE